MLRPTLHHCAVTGQPFQISERDLSFYSRVSPVIGGKRHEIPPPTLAPDERKRRRMSFRNERNFYARTIPKGVHSKEKRIISMYSPDKPYPILTPEEWWSDSWDGFDYGREFDFEKPFFSQFAALLNVVPRQSIYISNCENCDYNNYTRDSRNCYMSSLIACNTENAFYSYTVNESRDICDSLWVVRSELLYDCTDCIDCYDCSFLDFSQNCRNCVFGYGLVGCENCICCMNLRNKRYCIFNKQLTREEYERQLATINLSSRVSLEKYQQKFLSFKLTQPHRATMNIQTEDCSGENLRNCKHAHECFDGYDGEDISYLSSFLYLKDSMDIYSAGSYPTELCYECCVVYGGHDVLFSTNTKHSAQVYYSDSLVSCENCFGCVGLKHKSYCVFNKQYSKEEYERLVPQIIEHMRRSKEWGEFFPPTLSPFGYQESAAQDYMPLTKEEVLSRGYKWSEFRAPEPQVEKIISAKELPDSISEVSEDILSKAICCQETNIPFRIVRQELDFYRKKKIPLPHVHPNTRHLQRMQRRNPRKLWVRRCEKTGKEILSTFSPERPEIIYSEDAYQKEFC